MTTRKAAYSYKRRHNPGTYRSGLEELNSKLLMSFSIEPKYEQYYLEYVVPESKHKYTPDFVLPNGIIIETKGVWDAEDRKKHLLIKEQHPNLDIRLSLVGQLLLFTRDLRLPTHHSVTRMRSPMQTKRSPRHGLRSL